MKNRNFVNLNINPCKMCMPMGAVLAFKGIENCMVFLHGSQGCSTYIRRHMAGHFNEPVDIASSSLNEEGTVYGGESNLKKGLSNMIKLYHPSVIGVATTCLAETIGEDVKRITSEFMDERAKEGYQDEVSIIPVSTPGYGATQFEGYFAALLAIVQKVPQDKTPNRKVNVIISNVSPGDARNIKKILDSFGVDYILLPDVSNTLDAPYRKDYKKIPDGGTKIEDIKTMAGARATIEIGATVPENLSPGTYLSKEYGIPLYRCPLPVGLESTDQFIRLLRYITGRSVPRSIQEERGRYIDGMIDSHKHNGEGRAVLFGEPELVYSTAKICLENGINPVLISTGSQTTKLGELLDNMGLYENTLIIDDTDFETIQKHAVELQANILIGNSDGKVITEKESIPLVRIGFPIHDRVGGQRLVTTGYNGSMSLLDTVTNTLLEGKYEGYRVKTTKKYFGEEKHHEGSSSMAEQNVEKEGRVHMRIEEKTKSHPCFSAGACENARMHIPVAPACNISCNYCNRKYDCVNESRPGVTSEVLTPYEAAEKFMLVKEKLKNLKVVGIAGPGDALANFERTKKSIELIKEIDKDITFCLSTNGLMLPYHGEDIIKLGISHVTITINAIDPEIGAKIYKEVNFMGSRLTGRNAADILIKNQLAGLTYLSSHGIICKVNIVMIKGVNDHHIEEVVKKVKKCGAFITNIMPLIPAAGSAFENMPLTNNKELNALRKKCELDMKQMYHCKQCRADAIGLLGQDCSSEFRGKSCRSCTGGSDSKSGAEDAKNKSHIEDATKESGSGILPGKSNKTYLFAVATKSGMLIDQHFGHVEEFYIYSYDEDEVKFVEKRAVPKYCTGQEECETEEDKIDRIIRTVEGSSAVVVLRIGYRPLKKLQDKGIRVIQTCGSLEDGIRFAVKEMEKEVNCLETVVSI